MLGPNIDYYLPTDSERAGRRLTSSMRSGALVNSYSSDAPATGGRGGRGRGAGAAGGDPDDPDAAPNSGRGRGGFTPRVTKAEGMNRFVWDVRHQTGVTAAPGSYQARLRVGSVTLTQPFTVLIDPNVAADGVTVADLREQFEHNLRMRRLVADASQLAARVREAQSRFAGGSGADSVKANQIDAIAAKLFTEPVRYGKPGLQAHITLSCQHDDECGSKGRTRRPRALRDTPKRPGHVGRRARPCGGTCRQTVTRPSVPCTLVANSAHSCSEDFHEKNHSRDCLASVVTAPLSADLKYTTHMEVKKAEKAARAAGQPHDRHDGRCGHEADGAGRRG